MIFSNNLKLLDLIRESSNVFKLLLRLFKTIVLTIVLNSLNKSSPNMNNYGLYLVNILIV